MTNRILLISLIAGTTLLSACNEKVSDEAISQNSTSTLETVDQKASYSFGVDIAGRLAAQGIELDADAFARGVLDVFNKTELALDDAEMQRSKTAFQAQLREKLAQKSQSEADKNLKEGAAFLTENAKKEGVITTQSGLQYKIITTGDGAQPKASDTVTTHYRGTLIDGREFDSSIARGTPASFPVKGVIKGWTEALQLMHVGDKWELYIPSDLAYGKSKRSELIQANSTLIFELELLAIK